MIIRHIVLLLLLVGVSGCTKMAANPCPGSNPGFVQINITHNSTTTSAPAIKIAHPNDKLKFHLLGPPNKTVDVKEKTGSEAWFKGSDKKPFFVCVPADVKYPHDYGYSVQPEDSPLLDPVVRILH